MTRADAKKNRSHLLAVARELMEPTGHPPAFNALAKAAGVGVGTVYRHFADDHALLAALADELLTELIALAEAAREEDDAWTGFERLVRSATKLQLRHPVLAQLLAAPERVPEEVMNKLITLRLASDYIVARARKAKVLRASVKGDDVRRLVCGIDHAARSGDEMNDAAKRYLDIILDGMRSH